LHLTLLENAQQALLHGEAHLADLVQEERAAMRGFDDADAVAYGAGERTTRVAEEFALEERFGERTAVDGDEGCVATVRQPMDSARHQLLADPRLPRDEYRRQGATRRGDRRPAAARPICVRRARASPLGRLSRSSATRPVDIRLDRPGRSHPRPCSDERQIDGPDTMIIRMGTVSPCLRTFQLRPSCQHREVAQHRS
jgi:hypothetical protein